MLNFLELLSRILNAREILPQMLQLFPRGQPHLPQPHLIKVIKKEKKSEEDFFAFLKNNKVLYVISLC